MSLEIERNHEVVGKQLSEIRHLDLGTLYPVVGPDRSTIVGVFSAEFGSPEGYQLDEKLQAWVKAATKIHFVIRKFNPGQAKWVVGRATYDTINNAVTELPGISVLPGEYYQEIAGTIRYLAEVPYAISADTISGFQIEKVA